MNKQKEQRRKEILEAARIIINTEGYEACTVRKICGSVGVSSSSFYNCFADKDEVLFFIGDEIDGHFSEIEDMFDSENPRENLIRFIREYLSWIEDAGHECCWHIHISQHGGARKYGHTPDRAMIRVINRIIYQGRDLWYGDLNETEMYDLLMTTLRGMTFEWSQNYGEYSLTERAEKMLPSICRMIFRLEEQ